MTTSEAAKQLSKLIDFPLLDPEFRKAALLAIKALEAQPSTEIVPIGTKVRVTKDSSFHDFEIGELVTIVFYSTKEPMLPYICENEHGLSQWLSSNVFEIVKP